MDKTILDQLSIIINNINIIEKQQTYIINKFNIIEKQQIYIINELENIKNKDDKKDSNIIPIKKIDKPLEYIDNGYIDKNYIIKVMSHRNINTIIKIIKKIYLPNDKYILPIKNGKDENKKNCIYYYNEKKEWVNDVNEQLPNILFTNISKLLSEINMGSINNISMDDWDKNNDFINDLRTKSVYLSYYKKLLTELL